MKLAAAKNPDLQIKRSTEVKRTHKNKVELISRIGIGHTPAEGKGDRLFTTLTGP